MSNPIASLPPLKDLIKKYRLGARRKLGQNFLLDLNLTARIAREAGALDGTIIEIGPGPGGLTRALLMSGAERVIAIEKDPRACEALKSLVEVAEGRLTVIQEDAMETSLHTLGEAAAPRRIIANLPYNIATPLLLGWLDHANCFASMTLMFQREVAERIAAPPSTPAYGRLSIICQWRASIRVLFDIPPDAFVPQPKVISTVINLTPYPKPAYPAEKLDLENVTRVAFGQRRKMLRASLKSIGGLELLAEAGIPGDVRPETLSVEDFCRLAEILRQHQNQ